MMNKNRIMQCLIIKIMVPFALFLSSLAIMPAAISADLPLSENSSGANIILMRHALAPGTGDPANFDVDDCATQRNLSQQGIIQAKTIGATLAAQGLTPTRILSSPWCRCKDTAEALGLGPWEVHPGLSSFYQGHVDKTETLALLRKELQQVGDDELVLFVTHQVVISALTGIYVKSGGYLLENSSRF